MGGLRGGAEGGGGDVGGLGGGAGGDGIPGGEGGTGGGLGLSGGNSESECSVQTPSARMRGTLPYTQDSCTSVCVCFIFGSVFNSLRVSRWDRRWTRRWLWIREGWRAWR